MATHSNNNEIIMSRNDTISTYKNGRTLVRRVLTLQGFSNIKISNGYYYFTGFATKNGKVIYFSCNDTRVEGVSLMLFREAKDYNDYTGGTNRYCKANKQAICNLLNNLV